MTIIRKGSLGSQDIETATTAVAHEAQPDGKTRRYDRQLRLWAASGQSALENARLLVISGSATSTSTLKNLVLPGIGHFTILDAQTVTAADAGNNFFLQGQSSIGKYRAHEAVRLLCELNDGVEGKADTSTLEEILRDRPEWLRGFTLVITHNLEEGLVGKVATLLWEDPSRPPLIVIRSAGLVAEFFIQFYEHPIVETHSEVAPSLRLEKPFKDLLDHALSLQFDKMDTTDHSHIPYVYILVRVMEDWKKSHEGSPPKTYAEKQEFKKTIRAMKMKLDEENFDEAEAQAYRCWSDGSIPSEITSLFADAAIQPENLTASSPPFFHLLSALHQFTLRPPHVLPLSATLPDMGSDTKNYILLQNIYRKQSLEDKKTFKRFLKIGVDDADIDTFVKNAHGLKLLRGEKWGALDRDPAKLANALANSPKEAATHLALSAYFRLAAKNPSVPITVEAITAAAQPLLPSGAELPDEFGNAAGEIARAPTADLPNVAAFLGGMVAQETIKMITKQYTPVKGYCVIDLVDSWTGTVN